MLFPYGTDAPLYHYPIATVSCITINVAMFLGTGMGDYDPQGLLILQFETINPLQWITAAFMHASWMHLIGNMIFLWVFGLVVEGKLGWLRFSALYLVLALCKGAITQVPMYFIGSHGGALGASGAIFALMAVALVWAPDNDINCIFSWSFWIVREVDIPILGFSLFYFVLQLIPMLIFGFHMSTPLLHLLGMLVGFPVAIIMLRRGWVDCEGWDLFSRYGNGRGGLLITPSSIVDGLLHRKSRRLVEISQGLQSDQQGREALETIYGDLDAYRTPNAVPAERGEPKSDPIHLAPAIHAPVSADWFETMGANESLRAAVHAGNPGLALQWLESLQTAGQERSIDQADLVRLVDLLGENKRYVDCLSPLAVLAKRRGWVSHMARLRIAKIQWQVQRLPELAVQTIESMPAPWPPKIEKKRQQLLDAIRCATPSDNAAFS